jgi:hypothetical protein
MRVILFLSLIFIVLYYNSSCFITKIEFNGVQYEGVEYKETDFQQRFIQALTTYIIGVLMLQFLNFIVFIVIVIFIFNHR